MVFLSFFFLHVTDWQSLTGDLSHPGKGCCSLGKRKELEKFGKDYILVFWLLQSTGTHCTQTQLYAEEVWLNRRITKYPEKETYCIQFHFIIKHSTDLKHRGMFLTPQRNLQRSNSVSSWASRSSNRNISGNRSTALLKHKLYPTYKRDNKQHTFLLEDMKNKTVKVQESETTEVPLRNNEKCLNFREKRDRWHCALNHLRIESSTAMTNRHKG